VVGERAGVLFLGPIVAARAPGSHEALLTQPAGLAEALLKA